MRWRSTSFAVVAALAFCLVFGLAIAANGATKAEQKSVEESYRAKAAEKVARLNNSRITQEQREAAAAQVKLMKALGGHWLESVRRKRGPPPGSPSLSQPRPLPGPGGVPDYFGSTPNWAYSPLLRKFVDGLPGLGAEQRQQPRPVPRRSPSPTPPRIPAPTTTRSSCASTREKMHSDLPATTLARLRAGQQGNRRRRRTTPSTRTPSLPRPDHRRDQGPSGPHQVHQQAAGRRGGRPVHPGRRQRHGCRRGPATPARCTPQNRATLHLHGGVTPWISDGTPHQWITPAGEDTPYPEGVSVQERARHARSRRRAR